MPLGENDVKSELSYAYLHAVASRAGCECQQSRRYSDGMGIDARLMAQGIFAPPPALTRVQIEVQLKATSRPLQAIRRRWAYPLDIDLYEKLRPTTLPFQMLLVVLVLPSDSADWLNCTARALTLKRAAYWVSLRGAPETTNRTTQTVYFPKANLFTAKALQDLLPRLAREDWVLYEP
jgi:hypothetical protein